MTSLTHTNIETDLEKAKDGRWVLFIQPDFSLLDADVDGPTWDHDHIPPVVVAKWALVGDFVRGRDLVTTNEGAWTYVWGAGQSEGFLLEGAAGFVELSDLGLYTEEPDEAYIDVSSEGVAELVHPDGSREPAPAGWDDESGLKATRQK